MTPKLKRIVTDAAGYGLILLGAALGWLPGPGGIPLVLAGLGLLAINNAWAQKLRDYIIKHSGKLSQTLFPPTAWVRIAYDFLTIILLALVGFLTWHHPAATQISLGIFLFCMALLIAALNRERFQKIKRRK